MAVNTGLTQYGVRYPTGDDPYEEDEQQWREHAESIRQLVRVTSQAQRDAITSPQEGDEVLRLDQDGAPRNVWIGGEWQGPEDYELTLNTGWQNVAASIGLRVSTRAGVAYLNGLVARASGTETTIATIPPSGRPKEDVTFTTFAENGGAAVGPMIRIYVQASDGAIRANLLSGVGQAWNQGGILSRIPLSASWVTRYL